LKLRDDRGEQFAQLAFPRLRPGPHFRGRSNQSFGRRYQAGAKLGRLSLKAAPSGSETPPDASPQPNV
jgi:hypothetical protein